MIDTTFKVSFNPCYFSGDSTFKEGKQIRKYIPTYAEELLKTETEIEKNEGNKRGIENVVTCAWFEERDHILL